MSNLRMEYVDLKFLPSRSVTKVILEIDSSMSEKVVEALGLPGASLWVELKPIPAEGGA